jgi:hypothetical protein
MHLELCRIKKKGTTQLPVSFKNRLLLNSVTPYIELAALKHFLGVKGGGPLKQKPTEIVFKGSG